MIVIIPTAQVLLTPNKINHYIMLREVEEKARRKIIWNTHSSSEGEG